jgi:Fe-S cluster assembly ATP-binding protein
MSNLTLTNVSVSSGDKELVRDVSFEVEKGTISVLMGPNGSGKSSLVNALMGHPHYVVSQGRVSMGDGDITQLSTEKRAKKGLFLSLQHIPKIGGVTLANFLHKAYTATHASDISVLEFYLTLRTKVEGYAIDPKLLDRSLTDTLSGGEKKLSEVVQLLALEPEIAILDEIDSGVDVDALKTVFRVVNELAKSGKTGFLIISHHPSLLEHLSPSKVHVMTNGRLVRSGGSEIAKDILEKGFCAVASCAQVDACAGNCSQ